MAPPRPRSDRRSHPRGTTAAATRRRLPLALIGVPLLVVGIVLAFASGLVSTGPSAVPGTGSVIPEHTVHGFGTAKIHGGLLAASFPLTVDGQVSAIDLTTS